MTEFTAWIADKTDDGYQVSRRQLDDSFLMDGDVTVRAEYSSLNYKDGLALTGKAPVIRHFPLLPGIDLAGRVLQSDDPRFAEGDEVLLNGFGIGETHHGGYAGLARVSADWLLKIPEGLDARRAMAIGTAGYTAMLCVLKLIDHGITAADGPILVSGAAGGVGSIAVSLLAQLGFEVAAITGREDQAGFLRELGASEILPRADFSADPRPLSKERWQTAIDVAGGKTLANILSQIRYGGAVAACGLAESMELPASVAPFILRGVTLYGIDSVYCPMPRREQAWQRLAQELDHSLIDRLSQDIPFDDLPRAAEDILAGRIRGRGVVKIPS